MEVCTVRIVLEKLAQRQNSECCNADFWQVRRIGLSWNFKGLQWINPHESFRRYYIHYEDYAKRLRKFVRVVSEIYKKALIVQILNEVALRQVARKRVSYQDRKNEKKKFLSYRNMILSSILTLLKNNLSHL